MRILLNGAWRETRAREVAEALRDFGYQDAVVATALNGQFVPAEARARAALQEGDRLEMLAPMQGG